MPKSETIAVIGFDDAAVVAHVKELREAGLSARGLAAAHWADAPEPRVTEYHVVGEGAEDLKARIEKAAPGAPVKIAGAKVRTERPARIPRVDKIATETPQ